MRSIRRSMTLYLLGLVALTLGVIGVALDQLAGRTLDAREAASADLIETRFRDRCRDEEQRVDRTLLRQARLFGSIIQTQFVTQYPHELTHFLVDTGLLPLGPAPHPLPVVTQVAGLNHTGALSDRLYREFFAHLLLDKGYVTRAAEEEPSDDLVQINTRSGRQWRSSVLQDSRLPFDPHLFDERRLAERQAIDWWFDDTAALPSRTPVRRVILQVPLVVGVPTSAAQKDGADRPAGPFEVVPRLFVHCARPRAAVDRVYAEFAAERDAERADLRDEIRASRQRYRVRLLYVTALAFVAVAVGAPLLVRVGLAPVGALSDAVSRVTERDFRLPHDGRGLPLELRPIHDRLTRTLAELGRAFDREKRSAADISHELRTPVAALLATLDVALRKPRTADQYKATLDDCRTIARQLGLLVERVMTLATVDAARDRVAVRRADAAEVAAGCAAVVRPLAESHGLTLTADAARPVWLNTDPDLLREVLMNLLHNAVEYNRPGGRVGVACRAAGGRAVLEVRDTGIGMTPEVRDRIFERFYRADPARHATGVHAGLGLAIVREYVARLGGTVAVESEPGVGSTFRVSLPAAGENDECPTNAPPRPGGNPEGGDPVWTPARTAG